MNEGFRQSRRETANGFSYVWLRYLGIILPAVVNYGFLLVHGDQPHWGVIAASAVVLLIALGVLLVRRDWVGALWVGLLYFPLNAWPIMLNFVGGLHD
jgi:hypothetical protein